MGQSQNPTLLLIRFRFLISQSFFLRNREGKFVLDDTDCNVSGGDGVGGGDEADEGGFDGMLPPNRFRTRSVAIVAGYSPERLYSNMPSGQQSQAGGGGGASGRGGHFSVVESGMYKVGEADRGLAAVGSQQYRPEPIYWKQARIFF